MDHNSKITPRKILALLFRIVLFICLASGVAYAGLRIYSHFILQKPMNQIREESTNKEIEVRVRFEHYLPTGQVVFDIRKVGGPDIGGSVLNMLFELASKLQDRDLESVKISWKGRPILIVGGPEFKSIGSHFGQMELTKLVAELARASTLPSGKPLTSVDPAVLSRLVQIATGHGK